MKQNKRKINVLGLVGVLLILLGSGLIVKDLVVKYIEDKQVQGEINSFFNEPVAGVGTAPALADGDRFGVIDIPAVSTQAPIVQSANWDYLEKYVVAWPDRTLDKGNFAIAGHNGRCASCLFKDIHLLEIGDEMIITSREAIYTYEVYKNFEVHYTDVSVLEDDGDKTTLTLVTCEEAYVGSTVRVIVQGELKKVTPREGNSV